MKLNIQFFAEEDVTEKSALEALTKIMKNLENMEEYANEFDMIKKAISDKVSGVIDTEPDLSEYVPRTQYDELKKAYIERFGEFTEQKIDVKVEESDEESIYNIDFMFDGSTE